MADYPMNLQKPPCTTFQTVCAAVPTPFKIATNIWIVLPVKTRKSPKNRSGTLTSLLHLDLAHYRRD